MSAEKTEEARNEDLHRFYAEVGEIVVRGEQLNRAMNDTLWMLLVPKGGLDEEYAKIVLAGYNIENMRRYWTAMVKATIGDDAQQQKIVDKLSDQIDGVNRRRNDIVHRLWYTEFPGGQAYDKLQGIKTSRSFKSVDGIDYSIKKVHQFDELIKEMRAVHNMIHAVMITTAGGRPLSTYLEFDENNRVRIKG
jgi:GTP1/Obg family GTP-binding protein